MTDHISFDEAISALKTVLARVKNGDPDVQDIVTIIEARDEVMTRHAKVGYTK